MSNTNTFWLVEKLSPSIEHSLTTGRLAPAAVILCLLLAFGAYTDLFCGCIVPNWLSFGLMVSGFAVAPLLYPTFWPVWLIGGVVLIVSFGAALLGKLGEADAKLYSALAFIFGKSILLIVIASSAIGLLYFPLMLLFKDQLGLSGEGHKVPFPFAPAIALAVPATVALAGVVWWQWAGLIGLEIVTVIVCRLAGFGTGEAVGPPDGGQPALEMANSK